MTVLVVSEASGSCGESLSDSVSTGRKLQVTVKVTCTTHLRLHVACKLACVKRQSSLPCTVRRGAGVKKDSMRFLAIPLWMTVSQAGRRFFTRCSKNFRGGTAPCIWRLGGLQPPEPPHFLRQCYILSYRKSTFQKVQKPVM